MGSDIVQFTAGSQSDSVYAAKMLTLSKSKEDDPGFASLLIRTFCWLQGKDVPDEHKLHKVGEDAKSALWIPKNIAAELNTRFADHHVQVNVGKKTKTYTVSAIKVNAMLDELKLQSSQHIGDEYKHELTVSGRSFGELIQEPINCANSQKIKDSIRWYSPVVDLLEKAFLASLQGQPLPLLSSPQSTTSPA